MCIIKSEYVTVPEKVVYKIPDTMSFEAAAIVEPVACIIHAFDNTHVPLCSIHIARM